MEAPAPHPLVAAVLAHAASHPNSPAVSHGPITNNSVIHASYAQLAQLVRNVAQQLATLLPKSPSEKGIATENPHVAFLVSPSLAFPVVELALLGLGCTAIPLAAMSPPVELAWSIVNCEASLLVADGVFAEKMQNAIEEMGKQSDGKSYLPELVVVDVNCDPMEPSSELRASVRRDAESASGSTVDTHPLLDFPRVVPESSAALMLYTSGTTGKPKGVLHTVKSMVAQLSSLQEAWEWSPRDRTLHVLPLHHIHGLQNQLNCCLYSGGCVEFLGGFSAEQCLDRLCTGEITCFHAVPTVYTKMVQFLDLLREESAQHAYVAALRRQSQFLHPELAASCAGIRLMVCGSAALPVPTMQRWAHISGQILLERYGMTEIGMGLSNSYRKKRFPGCVGWPLPGVEARVRAMQVEGPESGRSSAVDADGPDPHVGEVLIRGPGVFREYWRREKETEDSFVQPGRWFRTGDCVRLGPDGGCSLPLFEAAAAVEAAARGTDHDADCSTVESPCLDGSESKSTLSDIFAVLGRISTDIIKTGGFKVSALEVETILLAHTAIQECAVVALPCPTWGEKVTAVVVLSNANIESDHGEFKTKLDLTALRSWAKTRMATYKVPHQLEIWEALPRNVLGKLEKKKIMKALEAGSDGAGGEAM